MAEAAGLYRLLVENTLQTLAGDWDTIVAFAPPERGTEMAAWLGAVELQPQVEGDLGGRMLAAIDGPTVIVGTDCPALSAADIDAAFAGLDEADVVLGPSEDGGYYLIGMTHAQPVLFGDMPWSTREVLPETRRRCEAAGLRRLELRELRDLDDLDDLRALAPLLPPGWGAV